MTELGKGSKLPGESRSTTFRKFSVWFIATAIAVAGLVFSVKSYLAAHDDMNTACGSSVAMFADFTSAGSAKVERAGVGLPMLPTEDFSHMVDESRDFDAAAARTNNPAFATAAHKFRTELNYFYYLPVEQAGPRETAFLNFMMAWDDVNKACRAAGEPYWTPN